MKRINDFRIYLVFGIIAAVIAGALAGVSLHSMLAVEKKAARHIAAGVELSKKSPLTSADLQAISTEYRAAFALVKSGQVFALYHNFDEKGFAFKKTLNRLKLIQDKNEAFAPSADIDLNFILERRMAGSRLGRNTAIFFAALAIMSFGFGFIEKKRAR